MMYTDQVLGIGHNGGPALDGVAPPPWLAGRRARLAPRGRSVATSGRAREWVLRFERRSPPSVEPLMGWTGDDDTLASQVELVFETCGQALAYADRQGFEVDTDDRTTSLPLRPGSRSRTASSFEDGADTVIWLAALQPAYGRCEVAGSPDLERALVNPAGVFEGPDEVLRHSLLSLDCKREILWRWAWDEHLKEVAAEEGMASGEPSRLDEVKAALLALGQSWTPSPAAPAAPIVAYRHDPRLTALAA